MKKIALIGLLSLLAVGCGEVTETKATITKVEKFDCGDKVLCGCSSGMDYHTAVKTSESYVANICAYVGEVGDSFTGYWQTGHWDNIHNGFSLRN